MPGAYVIVGGSLAGGSAAMTLREEGFAGDVVLLGEEPQPPYERPPLSKQYLRGEIAFEKMHYPKPQFYSDRSIDLRLGVRAAQIDARNKLVELGDGQSLPYEKLLITTGARNRRLRVPGAGLDRIFDLRTVADADRLRKRIGPGKRAVLVGMGFIGAEVAASLRQIGCDVAVIEFARGPLAQALGPEVSKAIADLHREHGVQMYFGEGVAAFEGGKAVECVVTTSGRRLECDFAVLGVGVEPAVELAETCGLEIDSGILVDEFCRTSADDIYAAGDVANHFHPLIGRRIRVEHWQNAIRQGAVAARNMMEQHRAYDEVHWFWSDQYDCNIQYAGFHEDWDELVTRGEVASRSFVSFYLQNGVVVAAVAVNQGRDLRRSMALIKARAQVDPALLRDPGLDLRKLAG